MKRKTPSRCAGAFFIATFAGPEGKGAVCGSRGALAGRKTSPQRAGRFCVATFAGSGGKGHYLGGKSRPRSTRGILRDNIRRAGRQKALSAAVDTLSRTEKRLRSDAGAFCVTTFAGQNGKARCPQRSGALAGGKTSPRQPHRSLRQKKHPTARGNAFSACPALMGGANTARRARSHLWRGARAAASAAISPPAPTRGAGRFSASRASMHRPPKTQMASRR